MTSIDRDTAAQKWYGYTITGAAGRICVVCHMHRTVALCSTPMEANAIRGEKCGTNCQPQIRTLDKPKPAYVPNMLTIPGYGRDDD